LTQDTTTLFLIGSLFFIIGTCILFFFKKKKLTGLLPFAIGLSAILITTIGPLSHSKQQLNNVLHINKNDITRILIKPAKYSGYENRSLINHRIIIGNRKTIESICSSIVNGEITNSLIKNPRWVCLLRLEKVNGTYTEVEVRNAGQSTLLEVTSNGYFGWHYGTIEADSLGLLLKELTK